MSKTQILLTNDDGIVSPGLWAAAAALSELGFVHVVAPRHQFSGAGRSMPGNSDGIIELLEVTVNDRSWQVYAVGGSPAQAVQHAIIEILPQPPDLVVSGINYGENIGSGITISGTVGAALEAAAMSIPALAVSLQTGVELHLTYSEAVDFSAAAHFTTFFARCLLEKRMPVDVDLLKVDVPAAATPHTPWHVRRLSRKSYYVPVAPQRSSWDVPGPLGYRLDDDLHADAPDTDVSAIHFQKIVSVTPLSLDLTSRVNLVELEALLRSA
jgi:5'-nucleotidase